MPTCPSSDPPASALDRLRVASTTCATCGSMIRAIANALPVVSSTTSFVSAKARREQLELVRLRLHSPRKPDPTVLGHRDLAEVAMDIQPDKSASPLLLSGRSARDEAGKTTTYGSVLAAHPGSRRGGQLQSAGSQPIEMRRPAQPPSRLEAAVPESDRRYAVERTRHEPHRPSFIPLQLRPCPHRSSHSRLRPGRDRLRCAQCHVTGHGPAPTDVLVRLGAGGGLTLTVPVTLLA
jgi:hypothetical protein